MKKPEATTVELTALEKSVLAEALGALLEAGGNLLERRRAAESALRKVQPPHSPSWGVP